MEWSKCSPDVSPVVGEGVWVCFFSLQIYTPWSLLTRASEVKFLMEKNRFQISSAPSPPYRQIRTSHTELGTSDLIALIYAPSTPYPLPHHFWTFHGELWHCRDFAVSGRLPSRSQFVCLYVPCLDFNLSCLSKQIWAFWPRHETRSLSSEPTTLHFAIVHSRFFGNENTPESALTRWILSGH